MFKSLRLGDKIVLGFSILLVIIVVLGTISALNMKHVYNQINIVDSEYMPVTELTTDIEEKTLLFMFELRGYSFTEGIDYYNRASSTYLVALKESIKNFKNLILKYPKLDFFREDANKIEEKVYEYEKFMIETKDKTENLERSRKQMENALIIFEENADKFLTDIDILLIDGIKKGNMRALRRAEKIKDINETRAIVAKINEAVWTSQVRRDPKILIEVIPLLDTILPPLQLARSESGIKSNQDNLDNMIKSATNYRDASNELVKNWLELLELNVKRNALGSEIRDIVNKLSDNGIKDTRVLTQNTKDLLNLLKNMIIIALIIAILIGIVAAYIIIKSITRPIDKIVGELSESAGQVSAASMQLSDASHELAESSTEQAASIEETASTLSESSSMVQQNTENTKQTSILVQETKYAAETGNNEMKNMMEAMNGIKKSSDAIGKIIKVIDDIAFQTNILALNAAVEAARAGDAGMGFAVVAEEVRNLAQRSAQAANDTATMIAENINISEKGVLLAQKVAEALKVINTKADKVDDIMQEVLAASIEQTQGISQINRAISQMEQVTHNIASTAEESSSASSELNAQAENMNFV
ncbi:MAG: methyl-accepting chemotaxis protein, partial [Fusobacteria bacterium]|nr:methyl-accepting chemotaxis protein [Fusobacteriota bacterium]